MHSTKICMNRQFFTFLQMSLCSPFDPLRNHQSSSTRSCSHWTIAIPNFHAVQLPKMENPLKPTFLPTPPPPLPDPIDRHDHSYRQSPLQPTAIILSWFYPVICSSSIAVFATAKDLHDCRHRWDTERRNREEGWGRRSTLDEGVISVRGDVIGIGVAGWEWYRRKLIGGVSGGGVEVWAVVGARAVAIVQTRDGMVCRRGHRKEELLVAHRHQQRHRRVEVQEHLRERGYSKDFQRLSIIFKLH